MTIVKKNILPIYPPTNMKTNPDETELKNSLLWQWKPFFFFFWS